MNLLRPAELQGRKVRENSNFLHVENFLCEPGFIFLAIVLEQKKILKIKGIFSKN